MLQIGKDADILLVDQTTLELKYMVAMGEIVKSPGYVKTNLFGL